MRSGVRSWRATTVALVASGAANSADLEPAVQAPSALWSWSGGCTGGNVDRGYGQEFFSNPYAPSAYGLVDTPVFLAGGRIGYNWQRSSWVFGPKLDASGAVSDAAKTCLTASGMILSANCKAHPKVFVGGAGRLGYAFGAECHTLAYLKRGVAWQNNRGDVINNNECGQCRRRRARLLQGARRGLSRHTPPAMLSAQDGERPGQGPNLGTSHHARRICAKSIGREPSVRRNSDRRLREKYRAKHGQPVECLVNDRDALLTFYDLLGERWDRLRTTNPIRSVFGTRYRTVRTNGSLSPTTTDNVQAGDRPIKDLAAAERRKSVAEGRLSCQSQRRH